MNVYPSKFGLALLVAIFSCTAIVCAAVPPTPKPKVVAAAANPEPTSKPNPLQFSGYERTFYFNRQNASAYLKGIGQINQVSLNSALRLHTEYHVGATPFTLGVSYVGADPLGANGGNIGKAADTTLPNVGLATLAEAYVQYRNAGLWARAGDQLFNSPWANASDSRVKAAYFQGIDARASVSGGWSFGVSRMVRWQSRVSSSFNQSTLLTTAPTSGFTLADVAYTHGKAFSADANLYQFSDIGHMLWLDGKWNPLSASRLNPYLAAQFGSEANIGAHLIGTIDSSVFGLQAGLTLSKNVGFAVSFDDVPLAQSAIALPAGVTCSATTHLLSASAGYFLPTSGTPDCLPGAPGQATVYYGGMASPYTDSYATDPLFTTSISQGMADRRSPGQSGKVAATFLTDDKRLKFVVSRAYYNYTNPAGSENTYETNLDGTYYLRRPVGATYRGLSIRDRYAERTQSFTQLYGGLPLFKYNRAQLEYDF